ncbi:cleavage and polyadenylation specificity factor73-I [Striga asiatica]|uniref:Cleavage and polyadenylation specificity factor73-I n=1 Tax=Striga asiatica TaxID=4170 RepID=A0A5A7R6H0_STRAF|nr:cleavage and polyadenylation specificity factor73-I [Striga asiatica]
MLGVGVQEKKKKTHEMKVITRFRLFALKEEGQEEKLTLGPQQLKYMTVRRDSSSCLRLSAAPSAFDPVDPAALEYFLATEPSLRDFMLGSHFFLDACSWSLIPCIALIPVWYATLLICAT